jgi:alpha-galactosidase
MTGERIVVDGGATVLVLGVGDDGRLHQLALGGPGVVDAERAFPTALYPLAYPTHGEEVLREPALRATHGTGSPSVRLIVDGHSEQLHAHGRLHRIELVDRVAPLLVTLCWRTWPALGVVEQWVEVTNTGDAPTVLHQAASASPALPGDDPWFTHWGGGWGNEWTETTEPLAPGTKTVASAGGVRPSLHRPPLALFAGSGRATETEGSVLATTVLWGGDTRFDAEMAMHRHCRLVAGYQHRGAERVLDPGERFTSPAAALVWSDHGIGPTSRALHTWGRDHLIRDGHRPRSLVFNNWEAMFFDLDTPRVGAVVDGAAAVGAELFLLDDGWFGDRYPRDDDTQGLGDWMVDAAKFPEGLAPVVDRTLASGMHFGLWVEPEMVNPRSELYERRPDWVVHEPGRERREERNQLVLDVLQPAVREHIVGIVDQVLAMHPGITYLKWDANRDLFECGSEALPVDRQSHLAIDRIRATNEAMAEVARRHPDVELMLCASGGGRSNLETLQWFHELWTSDDTDPVDRVRIQWGASHLLPASVLGAHVTRWGDKALAFGCAVALSARFGFDLDPSTMSDEERATAVQAFATAKRIRDLVQFGELHRLVSPVDSPRGALAYLAADAAEAVDPGVPCAAAFAYRLEEGGSDEPVTIPGLVAHRRYLVEDATPGGEDGGPVRSLTGAELADHGVPWPGGAAPSARVWVISPEA